MRTRHADRHYQNLSATYTGLLSGPVFQIDRSAARIVSPTFLSIDNHTARHHVLLSSSSPSPSPLLFLLSFTFSSPPPPLLHLLLSILLLSFTFSSPPPPLLHLLLSSSSPSPSPLLLLSFTSFFFFC
ncbi:hypothetical protein ACOMHN_035913 [Nucella lapillus]